MKTPEDPKKILSEVLTFLAKTDGCDHCLGPTVSYDLDHYDQYKSLVRRIRKYLKVDELPN